MNAKNPDENMNICARFVACEEHILENKVQLSSKVNLSQFGIKYSSKQVKSGKKSFV